MQGYQEQTCEDQLGVSFDLERLRLEGYYSDQLSAYRAKKLWIAAFEKSFLLDFSHDFDIEVHSDLQALTFHLRCDFLTACGRYAFWRLTHNQAPDVQEIVETAHLAKFIEPGAEESSACVPMVFDQNHSLSETETLKFQVKACLRWIFDHVRKLS